MHIKKSMSMLFLRKRVTNHNMICSLYSSPDFKYIATDEAQPYLLFLLWVKVCDSVNVIEA